MKMVVINDDIRCNVNNFSKGRRSKIKYIVVHYTASPNDTAEGEAKYFKNNVIETSAHYFVDGKSVYRSVMDSDTAWHCGANFYYHEECRNDNSIGVELCCKKKNTTSRRAEDKDWYFDEDTIKNAAKLVKYLMCEYDVPIGNVIRHYDVTHKICPAPFVHNEVDWVKFKDKLRGDDEMVTETYIKVNGKDIKIHRILKDGKNYIDIRGLENAGFEVGYDVGSKVPILNNKVVELGVKVDGNDKSVEAVNLGGSNFVKVRSLASAVGNFDVDFESGKVVVRRK